MASVIVVGGGISGLACAWGIRERAPDVELRLLEGDSRLGGVIGTRRSGGYQFDLGPSGWVNRNPSTTLLGNALGLAGEVLEGDQANRGRYVMAGGRLRRFPSDVGSFLRTDLLSVVGKSRLLMEPLIPHRGGTGDESALAFARRRLGAEAAAFLVDPVVAGIFAGNPQDLSLRATLPSMARVDAEGRSLLWTALRAQRSSGPSQGETMAAGAYVSYRRGMGQLVDALGDALQDAVELNTSVTAVRRDGAGWVVECGEESCQADAVVLAVPGPVAQRLLAGAHPEVSAGFEAVPYVPVAVVGLGYRADQVAHPMDGYGYLMPSAERGDVLGVLWPTSIFPGARAPDGRVLMRVMLGGARLEPGTDQSEEGFAARAVSSVSTAMGIRGEPEFMEVVVHRTGLPQYRVEHLDRVRRVRAACAELPGLQILGNALDGVGMNALTAAAERSAEAVVNGLGLPQDS